MTDRERIVETGLKTFMEVGTALLEISRYKDGALFKDRYETFEAYCKERWDFGRAHAHRLISAAEIYSEMSPRGDKASVLPTTERQLRALGRLKQPALRNTAWLATVEAVGPNPIRASDVEKQVRAVLKTEGLAAPKERRANKPKVHPIAAGNVTKIRSRLEDLRAAVVKLNGGRKSVRLIDEIEALLTGV